jgi:GNAT superfamily N-acetyltransferase
MDFSAPWDPDPEESDDEELLFDVRKDDANVQATMGVPKDNGPADMFHLWVHPAKRGEGYGSEVIQEAEQTAKAHGADALNITVGDESGDPEPFFESQGFERGMYEEGEIREEETSTWHQFTKPFDG